MLGVKGVPWWVAVPGFSTLAFFPITLAYVTVVQRALGARMILRQGLQYALARRGLVLVQVAVSSVVILFIALLAGGMTFGRRVGITAAGIVLLFLIGISARQLASWIDRRFFREAYKAEQLLAQLAESVGSLVELPPLLTTVTTRIAEALHISEIAVFLCERRSYRVAYAVGYSEPPGVSFADESRTVQELQRAKTPLPVYFDDPRSWTGRLESGEQAELDRLGSQLLVPLARRSELLGFLSLGSRLAEAPYSNRDVELLQSVAQQTALAVENSRLTTTIASETAEREVLQRELSIARDVQQRLLPQGHPSIPGLDCFGKCRPAREVGGDYYDFLELPNQVLGVAIGDVSGKGIPASLLMASLQASLRGQTFGGCENLEQLMSNINHLVYAASSSNRYATFFYAQYDRGSQSLTYVNAGHNAPIVMQQRDGQAHLLRLETGGPPVGLLPQAEYQSSRLDLRCGDLAVFFTDGISEAMNAADEEWGEEKFIQVLQQAPRAGSQSTVEGVFRAADEFVAGAPQHDDMTIVVMAVSARDS